MSTNRAKWIWVAFAILAVAVSIGVYRNTLREDELTDEEWLQAAASVEQLADQQRTEEAKALLRSLVQRKPEREKLVLRFARAGINLNDPQTAAAFLDQLAKEDATPPRLFLQGIVASMQQRAADAERYWHEAVTLNPKFGAAWERLAQLYLSQIRGKDLRHALEGLLESRPLTIDELTAYSAADEPFYSAEARLKLVEEYARTDPHDGESVTAVARYFMIEDRNEEAIAWLQSRKMRPVDVRLVVDASLQLGKPADAARALEPWMSDDSPPLPIARARGIYAIATSNWAEAAWYLRSAVSGDPTDTPAIYQLGQALDRLARPELAAAALALAAKNEQLSNLIFRIRRTTHLSVKTLSPLIFDACQLMVDLGRQRDARLWFQLLAREGVQSERINELASSLSGMSFDDVPPPELKLLAAAVLERPTKDRSSSPAEQASSKSADEGLLKSHPRFEDVHEAAGIEFTFEVGGIGQKWIVETLGGGVAAFDYDNDGWTDLYFAQGGDLEIHQRGSGSSAGPSTASPAGKLLRNLGNGRFEDVTAAAGILREEYGQGCSAGDYDNDGDADLFVACFFTNLFYRNNGDGTFSEISAPAQVVGKEWQTSVAFSDLNLDGNLDLYVTSYVRDPFKICRKPEGTFTICSPANYMAADDTLYLNRGDGTFEDISEVAGIRVPMGKGLGVIVADFTGDRRPDIYVANDGTPNFLFQNDGNNSDGICHFTEVGMRSGCAVNSRGMAQAGMGITCDDVDGNGWLDLVVTNFFNEGTTLYLNQGEGYFEDHSASSGLLGATKRLLGFGIQSIDFSLSGAPGLFIANGHIGDFGDRNEPWKMPPQVFSSDRQGRFVEQSKIAGDFFQTPALARAVVRLDFDRDHRPDLAVTYLDRPAALLKNTTEDVGNSIELKLIGTSSNRDGRGSRIEMQIGSHQRILELSGGDGFMCCNEKTLRIGMGTAEQIDVLRITWPSGEVSTMDAVQAQTDLIAIENGQWLIQSRN